MNGEWRSDCKELAYASAKRLLRSRKAIVAAQAVGFFRPFAAAKQPLRHCFAFALLLLPCVRAGCGPNEEWGIHGKQ